MTLGSELGNLPGIKFDEPFDSNLDSAFLPPLHDASKLLGRFQCCASVAYIFFFCSASILVDQKLLQHNFPLLWLK